VRPKTIIYFEWIIFGTLLLDVLYSYLSWNQIIGEALAEDATLDSNTAFAIAITALIFHYVLVGTLTLLVSRRSRIAIGLHRAVRPCLFAYCFKVSSKRGCCSHRTSSGPWRVSAKPWPMACCSFHPRDTG
jgi:hypothetical protein